MYRDIVVDEINATALIIAKIFGIKVDRTHQEIKKEFDKVLPNEDYTELENVMALSKNDLQNLLNLINTAQKN